MSVYVESGKDSDGRFYAVVYRMGREWKRFTSNGLEPFKSETEAKRYAFARMRAAKARGAF